MARRVARMGETRPEVVAQIEAVMKQKLSSVSAGEYAAAGAHGVLVGEALVTGGAPTATVREFAGVGVRATPGTRSRRTVRA